MRCTRRYLVLNNIKTFVSKATGKTSSESSLVATEGTSSGAAGAASAMINALQSVVKDFAGEKEWQCPCGHKFMAAGEWSACEPALCEVPNCPNPKYYLNGPGRQLLEAHGSVTMKAVDDTGAPAKPLPSSSSTGVGKRFGKK